MITHTIDSSWIPSQNKTNWNLQIWRICQNFNFFHFEQKTLHVTHLVKLLDKMCTYEMYPTSTVQDTDTILSADGQADGRTGVKVKPEYPPPPSQHTHTFQLRWGVRYKYIYIYIYTPFMKSYIGINKRQVENLSISILESNHTDCSKYFWIVFSWHSYR